MPRHLKAGVHGSGLTLDFRSNRINTGGTVLVSLSCTKPQTYSVNIVDDQDDGCTPSMGLGGTILRELDTDDSDVRPMIAVTHVIVLAMASYYLWYR